MRTVLRLVFGRIGLTAFFLLLQMAALCAGLRICAEAGGWWFAVGMALAAWTAVLAVLASGADPGYQIAWCILILTLPVFGVLCYLLFGGRRYGRTACARLEQSRAYLEENLPASSHVLARLRAEAPAAAAQSAAISRCGGPVYYGGCAVYFSSGEACFCAMLEALNRAEHSIYMEYFILRPGIFWDTVLSILRRKAAQGLDVRVIYDDFGCVFLPDRYPEILRQDGIACQVFNRFRPVLSARMGNRDHRKLMIVDGKVCFTGGVNLADEYIELRRPCGRWKDSALQLMGAPVRSFTALFLAQWSALRGTAEAAVPPVEDVCGAYGYVQPYWDVPAAPHRVGRDAILGLVGRAERIVQIMTPYLIPDETMVQTLCLAAVSGVQVQIVTPAIGDRWYVQALSRAYYERLIEAGVEIYEYTPGFLHAKVCCADETTALVGTVNLDFRSFYLQYEDGVWLYGAEQVAPICADFAGLLPQCRRITRTDCRSVNPLRRAVRAILRLLAPLV